MNPLLAEEIHAGKTAVVDEKKKRIKHFIDNLYHEYQIELQSSAHILDKMHGNWSYISQSFENSKKIEKRIRKASSLKHYLDEVDRIFSDEKMNIDLNHQYSNGKKLKPLLFNLILNSRQVISICPTQYTKTDYIHYYRY